MKCDICPYLNNSKDVIFQTKYWQVNLGHNQGYLGYSVAMLKRHCPNLSELTTEEWLDFSQLVKKTENLFIKTFGASLLNWSCLMNGAYESKPANPHVHWHIYPRYERDVRFAEITFTDPEFGDHYFSHTQRNINLPEEILQKIVKALKDNLKD